MQLSIAVRPRPHYKKVTGTGSIAGWQLRRKLQSGLSDFMPTSEL